MDNILQNISQDWLNIIYKGKNADIYNNINNNDPNWFNWCKITKLDDIKVIILCHDLYSHKSLINIYKCLLQCNEIEKIPDIENLNTWAEQGILLLNLKEYNIKNKTKITELHKITWEMYINKIIESICQYHYEKNRQLIFMVWGDFAKRSTKYIDADFHIILEWDHPSSPSSKIIKNKKLNFIYCNHFTQSNKLLLDDDEKLINWNSINIIKIPNKIINHNVSNSIETILNININHHIAFTDGGAHPNNKSIKSRAGWAACFVSGSYIDKLMYGNLDISKYYASNIRAEGYAIIRVMELVDKCDKSWNKLTIITDCMFWIDMIEKYMKKWKANVFDEKSNPDFTKRMWDLYNKLSGKGKVIFMHVRSHNKDGWKEFDNGTFERFCYDKNDYVDKVCNHARTKLNPFAEIITTIHEFK